MNDSHEGGGLSGYFGGPSISSVRLLRVNHKKMFFLSCSVAGLSLTLSPTMDPTMRLKIIVSIFGRFSKGQVIVFTHIPKTAGTTFKSILYGNFGIHYADANKTKREIFNESDLRFAMRVFFGLEAISGHNIVDPGSNMAIRNPRLITFLRDPVVRCASHYQHEVVKEGVSKDFNSWIAEPRFQNLMVRTIAGAPDLERAKSLLKNEYLFVGFTERFNESLQLLNVLLDKPLDLKYREFQVARSNEVKSRILGSEENLSLLKKHNGLDMRLYDYTLKELYLPMLEKYKDRVDSDLVLPLLSDPVTSFRFRSGYLYNKFVYRQLLKLFGGGVR